MSRNEVKIRLAVDGAAQVQGALSGAEDGLQKLNSTLVKTAHYGAGLLVVAPTLREMAAGFVRAADGATTLRSQLQLAVGSAEKASAAYEALFQIAQKSRTSFTELGATFATIARAGQALGLSQDRLLTVTEAIGNAMAISGGSAQGMQAALVQLGQGLSSGTLRGEELNSVMEQSPRLAKALADGLGIPIGQLRKLGEQGALTSQMVIGALEKSAPQLAKELAGASLTVGQAFTMLTNSATRFIGEADRASGASGTLAGALKGVAGALDGVGATIKEHQTAFAVVGGVLAGAAAVAGVAALAKGLLVLKGAIGGIGAAVAALNPAALALLGIGAAVGGVVAASRAYDQTAAGIQRAITKLQAADAELLRLREALARNPGDTITAQYIKDLERDTPRRVEALRTLRQELAQLNAGSAGSAAEDARLDRGTQAFAERTQRAEAQAAVLQRLSGVSAEFGKSLAALHAGYAAGEMTIERYRDLVASLIEKEGGGKEIMAAAAAARARAAQSDGQQNKALAERIALMQRLYGGGDVQASVAFDLRRSEIAATDAVNNAMRADALEAAAQAAAAGAKAQAALIRELDASAESVARQVQRLQDEEQAAGIAAAQNISLAEALEQVAIARLQEQQAVQMSYGDEAAAAAIQREIDKRRELAGLIAGKDARDAAKKAADGAADDWKRASDQISGSLTDALLRGFESGKGFAENLRDTVVNLFKTLVLRPVIQAVVTPIAGTLTGALGFSGAAHAAGSGGSALGSVGNLASLAGMAGSLGSFGTAAGYGLSAAFGGTATTAIGSGLSMMAAGSVAQGAGLAAGAAAPYVLAAIAAYQIFKAATADKNAKLGYGSTSGERAFGFGRGTDVGSQSQLADIARAVQGGISGTAAALGGSAAGINIQTATDIDRKGKGSGVIGVVKNGAYVSGVQTGGTDPFAAAATKLGDASQLGDWFAKNTSAAIIAGLQQSDLPARFRDFFGSVEAFGLTQETASAMLATASAVQAVTESLTPLGGVFGQIAGLSVPAVDALAKLSGGVDALQQKAGAYAANFYSDAERQAMAWRSIGNALGEVGLSVPATREAFRGLVDSLNLGTDAGQRQFAALMNVSSAFAELVPATEALAAAGRTAADIARERAGLERALLEAQGDTAALRRLDLAALDESNRALLQRIHALADEKAAQEAAAQAAQQVLDRTRQFADESAAAAAEAVNAALQWRNALGQAGQGIAAVIDSLLGAASPAGSLAAARAAYNSDLALARRGDADASARITGSARALVDAVRATASDPVSLARQTSAIAGQLQALPATLTWQAQLLERMQALQGNTAAGGALAAAMAAAVTTAGETVTQVARNITLIADASGLTAAEKTLLLLANSAASRQVQLAATLSTGLTADQRALLLQGNEMVVKAVTQQVTGGALTADQRALLQQATAAVTKTVTTLLAGEALTADQSVLLSQATETVAKTVQTLVTGGALTNDQRALLLAQAEGITKAVATVATGGVLTNDQRALLLAAAGSVTKAVATTATGGVLTADQRAILNAAASSTSSAVSLSAAVTFSAVDPLQSIFNATKLAAEGTLAILTKMSNGTLGMYVSLARHHNGDGAMDIGVSMMRGWSAWGSAGMPIRTNGFAAGGDHAGGVRIVGERGPELEITGPARIFSAAQTAAMLGGGGASVGTARLEALVQALTAQVQALRAEARATATHTAKTARLLDLWDGNGLTVKTDADTPLSTVAA